MSFLLFQPIVAKYFTFRCFYHFNIFSLTLMPREKEYKVKKKLKKNVRFFPIPICPRKPFTKWRVTLSSNVHRLSLSPWGLSQPTSTIQNQIPYATGSLIGFTHQRGLRAVIGRSLQGPHGLALQRVFSTDRNSCMQCAENQRGCAADLEWWFWS